MFDERSVIEEDMPAVAEDREPTPVTEEIDCDTSAAIKLLQIYRVTLNGLRVLCMLRHGEDLANKHAMPLLGGQQSFEAYSQMFEGMDFILGDMIDEAKELEAKFKSAGL